MKKKSRGDNRNSGEKIREKTLKYNNDKAIGQLGSVSSVSAERNANRRERFWREKSLPLIILAIAAFLIFQKMGWLKVPLVLTLGFSLGLLTLALRLSSIISTRLSILISSALILFPSFYIRSDYKIYYPIFEKFGTYPGDLWYCWNNYLVKGFPYPREYPSGFQMIFRFIFRMKEWLSANWHYEMNYESYIIIICALLTAFAVMTTYILCLVVERSHRKTAKLWIFWIVAPTYMWYGLLNMDFVSVFTIMMSYYLFTEEEYYLSSAMIALGTAMKVFPIFITPLLFFQAPKDKRLWSVLTFIGVWIAFNAPFIYTDRPAWQYPYEWQIKENYAKTSIDGSYFWVITRGLIKLEAFVDAHFGRVPLLGNIHRAIGSYQHHIGKISLLLYAVLYYIFLRKKWDLPFARRCLGIMMLFILTDRVYSPQYNLYILPFLALVDYRFEKKSDFNRFFFAYYLMEIINVAQVMFLFKFRHIEHQFLFFPKFNYLFQGAVLVKYLCMIYLFYVNWTNPVDRRELEYPDGSGRLNGAEDDNESPQAEEK